MLLTTCLFGTAHAEDMPSFLVIPSVCYDHQENDLSVSVAPETQVFRCQDAITHSVSYVAIGPDLSWPIILTPNGVVSFEDEMYRSAASFGAGLLFFDKIHGKVWLVDIEGRPPSYIFGFQGNDPNTLARRPSFISVTHNASLRIFGSFGQALDHSLQDETTP